jgi:hypothetical protein
MSTQTVIEGVVPPPAPKRTPEMVRAAVLAYIERHSLNEWGTPADAARDIADAWHNGMDGYALAKKLEDDYHWGDLCLQDAEDLDSIGSVVREAEGEARKAWVAEWDIKPPLPVGTSIMRGVIASVCEYEAATYLVKEHGCTQQGRHLLVRFEDAKATGATP